MHPAGYVASRVADTSGILQAGAATPLFTEHAAIWSGTAASFVDLHPVSDPLSSVAHDLGGAIQTGSVTFTASGPTHAALWSSQPLSYVDIHPSGDNSIGYGTDGISIVGEVSTLGGGLHSCRTLEVRPRCIHRSASSRRHELRRQRRRWRHSGRRSRHRLLDTCGPLDRHGGKLCRHESTGAGGSRLRGVDGGFQVGEAFVGPGASFKAGIWSGTPASFVNLHSFLTPFTFSSSDAWGVWSDGVNVYVAGSAFNDGFVTRRSGSLDHGNPRTNSLVLLCLAAAGIVALRFRRRS